MAVVSKSAILLKPLLFAALNLPIARSVQSGSLCPLQSFRVLRPALQRQRFSLHHKTPPNREHKIQTQAQRKSSALPIERSLRKTIVCGPSPKPTLEFQSQLIVPVADCVSRHTCNGPG